MNKYLRNLALAISLVLVSSVAYAFPSEPTFDETRKNQSSRQATPYREIQLVRFPTQGANSIAVSGDVAIWNTVSDDGVSIALTTTSADARIAGVVCVTIFSPDNATATSALDDIGHRNWGWIITRGLANVKVTAGGTNGHGVGDVFITSTDSGAATTVPTQDRTTAAGAFAVGAARGGVFYNAAVAADTTALVNVDLS